jgi:SAM-dependent methyltransferase
MHLPVVERFAGRAGYYADHRPGYPSELADLLIGEAKLTTASGVADIGAGTGISAGLLVERGFRVYAVEPNASMRAEAEASFAGQPGFLSVDGTAEATTLAAHSMRLVMAGTAFHWFQEAAARAEFLRILRPDGLVALFWNRRLENADAFSRGYDRLLHEHTAYATAAHRAERSSKSLAAFFGAEPAEAHFENAQQLDFDGLLGRVLSSSYAPLPDAPGYGTLLSELRLLFDRHQQEGVVALHYDACVYYGSMKEPAA